MVRCVGWVLVHRVPGFRLRPRDVCKRSRMSRMSARACTLRCVSLSASRPPSVSPVKRMIVLVVHSTVGFTFRPHVSASFCYCCCFLHPSHGLCQNRSYQGPRL
jgi:hypothetical protein